MFLRNSSFFQSLNPFVSPSPHPSPNIPSKKCLQNLVVAKSMNKSLPSTETSKSSSKARKTDTLSTYLFSTSFLPTILD